jgi:uncharacterized phage protein gp47/JayE
MSDYQYINATGVIVADTAAVQTEVQNEFKVAFGEDLVVTPNTPQGLLITAETIARSNMLRNNAALANQINPNFAGNVFLDAIWALTGGRRRSATPSYITGAQLNGIAGTVIPAGSQASLADGTLFESVSEVTLDGLGLGTVDFQAVENGPIAANPGTLTQVVTAILGWDQVTNPTAAVLGRNLESDQASRIRRRNTLSLQNVALPEAITSALYDTEGVRSLAFRENFTDVDATIDGIFLLKHSIWVCVDGGTDLDVATTLLENKSLGANWNGGTTVNVTDQFSGQVYPVKFERPTPVPVLARVTVRVGTALVDVAAAVRSAILAYANGELEGEPGFVVGGNVSAFELAGAVNRQTPGIFVQLCEVSFASPVSYTTSELAIALDEKATITSSNITVIVV